MWWTLSETWMPIASRRALEISQPTLSTPASTYSYSPSSKTYNLSKAPLKLTSKCSSRALSRQESIGVEFNLTEVQIRHIYWLIKYIWNTLFSESLKISSSLKFKAISTADSQSEPTMTGQLCKNRRNSSFADSTRLSHQLFEPHYAPVAPVLSPAHHSPFYHSTACCQVSWQPTDVWTPSCASTGS